MVIGGLSFDKNLVETIELPEHPWFFASRFHPEFTSTPRDGHPLFKQFINAAINYRNEKGGMTQECKSVKINEIEISNNLPFDLWRNECFRGRSHLYGDR